MFFNLVPVSCGKVILLSFTLSIDLSLKFLILFCISVFNYIGNVYIPQVETTKKKVKKTNITVAETVYGGLSADELQKAVEKEFEMALQDRVMEETKDKKNAVEAYVYDMRNKVIHFSYYNCRIYPQPFVKILTVYPCSAL